MSAPDFKAMAEYFVEGSLAGHPHELERQFTRVWNAALDAAAEKVRRQTRPLSFMCLDDCLEGIHSLKAIASRVGKPVTAPSSDAVNGPQSRGSR